MSSPTPRRRGPGSAIISGPGRAARWIVVCWTVIGAIGLAYLFACSTVPVTITGEAGWFGPSWLGDVAVAAAIFLGLPNFLLPVSWLPLGLRYLRRAGYRRWRLAAWIAGSAAAVALEAVVIMGTGVPGIAPDYVGAPIVSWIDLAESAAFLVIGAALAATLTVRRGQLRDSGGDL